MKTLKQFLPFSFLICGILSNCGNNTNNSINSPNGTDSSTVNYIIITPTGGSTDTLYFTDRNLCTGSYSSAANNTYCILNDTITHQSVSLTFDGNTTGSPAFTFGYLSYSGGSYSCSGITGTVSLYEAIGGKIKGTFSGTFSDGAAAYQGRGGFTVNRTQ